MTPRPRRPTDTRTIRRYAALLALGAAGLIPAAATAQAGSLAARAAPVAPVNMMHAYGLAMGAAGAGDLARADTLLRQADAFAPGHPLVVAALARVQARAGDAAGALATLRRLTPLGAAADLAADSAFAALRASPDFVALTRRIARAAAPLVRSDTAAVLPDPDLIPESVGYDPADGSYYLGSLAKRKVVRYSARGRVTDLVASGRDGLGRVLGVRVQPGARRLWVANWVPDARAPRVFTGGPGWAQLHVYVVPSGRLVRRLALRDTLTPHLLNDVAFAPNGDAYLTDSHGGRVYRVRAGADSLELFHDGGPRLVYPNGLAVAPGGGSLYVAHVEGLLRLDLRSGRAEPVRADSGTFAGNIDGLYACGRDLVGVQGVLDYDRVVRLRLDPSGARVAGAEVLERRHPAYDVPTTGVLVGGTLVYVADSQLRRLRDDGAVAAAPARPTVLLRLRLRGGCPRPDA